MPVWLSLFLAVVAVGGFFATAIVLVVLAFEGKKAGAKPSLHVCPGDKPGSLTLWSSWRPSVFNVQVYRIRMSFLAPDYQVKEGTYCYTFDPLAKNPFALTIELPAILKELIEVGARAKGAMITIDMRTVEEITIQKELTLRSLRKIYHGKGKPPPASLVKLPSAAPDPAPVMTLDYEELVVRRKKIRDLEAAAKAKAAKAPPKPAAVAAPIPEVAG